MSQSFWRIPNTDSIRTPLSILKEQASALTEQTGGALRGFVRRDVAGNDLILTLRIVVSALNNYSIDLIKYWQPVQMYPGNLEFTLKPVNMTVENEEQFRKALMEILSSDEVTRIIASLLSQALA